ncbi:HNH endonuclease family protein [Vreelandella populi]|uniref:HNH endonuclease family protein n=2 Tax=Halomonadaceae TaxID=28256 RepID=UPI00200DD215|nr:HNH endonuclease family protein [Halomonas populi]
MATKVSLDQAPPVKVLKNLRSSLDSARMEKDTWKYVEKNFRGGGFYEWSGIKYFLYEYDLSLREQSKTYREKISWEEFSEDMRDHNTVEHIYPQKPMKPCWKDKYNKFSAKERKVLRHSLGNLVPLSRPKNSSFQNKCFEDKKGNEKNKVGFRYGSYAENEIAMKSQWTAVEILERGVRLLDFMEKRWGFSIGDYDQKVRILGLEFVGYEKSASPKRSRGQRTVNKN